eukprot:1196274-Prorocentrum_minimum.AAC.3
MGGPHCIAPLLCGYVYKPNMQLKGTCIIKSPPASTTIIVTTIVGWAHLCEPVLGQAAEQGDLTQEAEGLGDV